VDGDKETEDNQAMLDIIIVNYNSTGYLQQCTTSIYKAVNGHSINIFVQDNASIDNVDRITDEFPQVRLCKNEENLGFAKAVNRAIREGTSPYVMLLNPDTCIREDFFQTVLDYMEENPETGALGPRILNHDGTIQGSARSFPTPFTAFFGRNSIMTRLFPGSRFSRKNILTDRTDGSKPVATDWVSGACMLVRRETIEDVGALDERFFMYWEDADWCRRMIINGWRVVYFPMASVVHYIGASSNHALFRSTLEFHRSAYFLYCKHNKSMSWVARPFAAFCLSVRFLLCICVRSQHLIRRRYCGPRSPYPA